MEEKTKSGLIKEVRESKTILSVLHIKLDLEIDATGPNDFNIKTCKDMRVTDS